MGTGRRENLRTRLTSETTNISTTVTMRRRTIQKAIFEFQKLKGEANCKTCPVEMSVICVTQITLLAFESLY